MDSAATPPTHRHPSYPEPLTEPLLACGLHSLCAGLQGPARPRCHPATLTGAPVSHGRLSARPLFLGLVSLRGARPPRGAHSPPCGARPHHVGLVSHRVELVFHHVEHAPARWGSSSPRGARFPQVEHAPAMWGSSPPCGAQPCQWGSFPAIWNTPLHHGGLIPTTWEFIPPEWSTQAELIPPAWSTPPPRGACPPTMISPIAVPIHFHVAA